MRMSNDDEPKLFNPRVHKLCACERVLESHCEYFKLDGGLFHNCVYRLGYKETKDSE